MVLTCTSIVGRFLALKNLLVLRSRFYGEIGLTIYAVFGWKANGHAGFEGTLQF
jgi:hypothetical protein